jgi:hypothetical protein
MYENACPVCKREIPINAIQSVVIGYQCPHCALYLLLGPMGAVPRNRIPELEIETEW